MKPKVLDQMVHRLDREGSEVSRLTGVSNAIQAMILGHNGALLSGLVFMNSKSESAANSPPMLRISPGQC